MTMRFAAPLQLGGVAPQRKHHVREDDDFIASPEGDRTRDLVNSKLDHTDAQKQSMQITATYIPHTSRGSA